MAAILNRHFETFPCKIQVGNKQISIQQVKNHKNKFVTNFYLKMHLALFSHLGPSLHKEIWISQNYMYRNVILTEDTVLKSFA